MEVIEQTSLCLLRMRLSAQEYIIRLDLGGAILNKLHFKPCNSMTHQGMAWQEANSDI